MLGSIVRPAAVLAAAGLLGACAALPPDAGRSEAQTLVDSRRGGPLQWNEPDQGAALETYLLAQPLSVDGATQLAFLRNARIRQEYARLGIASADVFDAGRLANPSFEYSRLTPRDGDGGSMITRGISLDFAGLLLLPSRKRLAQGEYERAQQEAAAALMGLAAEVESGWYAYVAARQVTAMREAIARAGEAGATLAQRFHDAGNINQLQLALEQAAATQARLAAVRAKSEELRARNALAGSIGLSASDAWTVPELLPAPPPGDPDASGLLESALAARLDLAAARRTVATLEDAGRTAKGLRLLGAVEIGYEREKESDGARLHGPTLDLQLPVFNQGQGAVLRAQAQLDDARAGADALELAVRNEVALSHSRLVSARDVVERYRTALLPQRETVVARTQEEVNFMLKGVFELIRARQDEFDAYQEYLEAVRDYWLARVELRRAVGGRLPDDGVAVEATLGVDAILAPASAQGGMDHSGHGMAPAKDETEAEEEAAHEHHQHGDQP